MGRTQGLEVLMNERIRELKDRAWATCEEPEQYMDKFAELLIRECAEAALAKGRASPDTDFRTGSYVISEYLLARYGVE